MSLDELLNSTFGSNTNHENQKFQQIEKRKQEYRKQIKKEKGIQLSESERNDLIIALNYAINSIKNKQDVKNQEGTRFEYFKRWTNIQNKLRKK